MWRWIVLVLAVVCAVSRPRMGFAESDGSLLATFNAQTLLHSEISLIQTALAASGDYSGEVTGAWDGPSQHAFEGYATRTFQQTPLNLHAAALMIDFADTVAREGWDLSLDPATGLSFALPLGSLKRSEISDGVEWVDGDGGLSVLAMRQTRAEATSAHAAVAEAQVTSGKPIIRRSPDHWVTEITSAAGPRIIDVSYLVNGGWSSLRIITTPKHTLQANLIAASITPGEGLSWSLPAGGLLESLVGETFNYLATSRSKTASGTIGDRPVEPATEQSTGSGFYVAPNLLVTASHVVGNCERVTLVDGTPLSLAAEDTDLDLAALHTPSPVGHWLRLGAGRIGLGQKVNAVGYPYFGLSGTGLNVAGGNVSALAGLDDDKRFLSVTAPVQPGNSGGPLLARDGAVAGVVVSRLSEDYISRTTGSLPQNVNFAVQSQELTSFLSLHHLSAKSGGMAPFDMEEGAPSEMAETVVPIVCD